MNPRELDLQIFTLAFEYPKNTYLHRKKEDFEPKKCILNESQFNILCGVYPGFANQTQVVSTA